ncbi:MJ1255/VC2487 family glycosyltransferase [Methylomagnum ishizawai]|uniref:MJ1255/VC2487 family glycosyltransferase n=1 Tax=Methylomagnum ishizawai TaxID=1760988 RepID=UPI001C33521E|nr:MJ1255/VC2487 family glycosyltransferase [Methylomagnum ishizawai]BBL75017.1 glycosyl transferase [Methylomagnum ishizawai]
MKIFYGVQATGNGHITRARVMAPRLRAAGIEVTYLFTGRPWEQLFEMEVFGDYQWRRGLTFHTHAGRVSYLKTAIENNPTHFWRDIQSLDLSGYDLVITDFEPVTAWAARLRGIKTIGLGHQYAFPQDIPITGDDIFARNIMRYFAPATTGLGLHWHHFGQPILPPVIETPEPGPVQPDKILVYLPFEEIHDIVRLFQGFRDYQFHVYTHHYIEHKPPHIHIKQLSRAGFQNDLRDAAGVICNAGFELACEALQMGKKLLVKPLRAQMEQLSNALALEETQLGAVMPELDAVAVDYWLKNGRTIQVVFPDVGQAIVEWLLKGEWRVDLDWAMSIWDRVVYRDPANHALQAVPA